jgi:myo-inositol-1(or 4)-monophosphatase
LTESPQQSASAGFTEAELEHVEKSVVRAAMEAGEFVASRFGGVLEISNKGDKPGKDLVTDVDKASQRMIAEIMAETCPGHLLLGEEDPPAEEPDAADWLWVVDPIDGTTNFVNSSLIHAVSVAALYKGTPIAVAMRIPWSNDDGYLLMHARKGNGSWVDGSRVNVRPPSESGVPVAGAHAAAPRWIRRAFNILKPLQGNLGELRDGGSACYEQFMVARGSMQYAITGVAFTWDFAAGTLLTKEAGGKVMVLGPDRRFKEFNGWSDGYANDSATYGRIRKWKGLILSGAPATVDFVAANLEPKKFGFLSKLKSMFS